ncbi:MAG: poly-gamma-glutamate biosynthesis protein PgsC/CapC [Sphingomicrobium sp.]
MDWWPLPIFPDGSLASSVVTTVWVGVFVVCLLNLRFGWVLSGLVVPGYIVPLLIAKPISAVVVLAESSLTYGLFWLLSERLSGPNRWSSFFGRDRFMGLILVSVGVRLLFDGWLLPNAADHLNERYGLYVNWKDNLHSFGLIVVALLANQLWKPGYVRGMVQALVMIAVTALIVRFVLMEFTNFRIGAVVYLYEDFASSVLASPKAYIILIATCFIASRMNLRYGWDFSGILIPALLALQWYQPWKIVTSLVEAFVIYFIASALLSSRLFASATIEGAHKILLFFNISFAYKLFLGFALAFTGVEQRITDYYGFGYLLPTLIAIKAYDKNILARVTRGTVQISFMGALAGSLAGFLLTIVFPDRGGTAASAAVPAAEPPRSGAWTAAVAAGSARVEAASGTSTAIAAGDTPGFRTALALLDDGRATGEARALLREAGFSLRPLQGGRFAIVPAAGGGLAVLLHPRASRRVALLVPDPAATPGLALAAHALFERLDVRWLVIGGARPRHNGQSGRGVADEFAGALDLPLVTVSTSDGDVAELRVVGEGAIQLDLRELRRLLPNHRFGFGAGNAGGSELKLPVSAVERLLAQAPAIALMRPEDRFTEAELAFIRFDILEPLLAGGMDALPTATKAAAAVGIQLGAATAAGGEPLIGLRRAGQPAQLYLIRPAGSGPIFPLAADERLTGIAAGLFERMNGRAMLIVPNRTKLDGEEAQLLPMITQAMLRRAPQGTATIQLRRLRTLPEGTKPLLALDRIEPSGGFGDRLLASLRQAGIDAQRVENGPETAGLEIAPSAQLRYLQQAQGGRVAFLWLDGAR